MASTRRRTSLIAGVAVIAAFALPAAAQAVVYCVPHDTVDPSCDSGQGKATIQAALNAAALSSAVADTVHIDAGSFSEPALSYVTFTPTNVLTVEGEGTGQTLLSIPNPTGLTTGLVVGAPAGSTVRDLAMTIPTNADSQGDIGIDLGGDVVGSNLLVNGPTASNARGVTMHSSTVLENSTVNLPFASPTNTAVSGGSTTVVRDSVLHANNGARYGTVERSHITASNTGASLDVGTLAVRDTLIDLGANNSAVGVQVANFNNSISALSAVVDGVTIVGGGSNSAGIRVQADSDATVPIGEPGDTTNDGETATGMVSNTVISGPAVSLRLEADRGEVANLTSSYSNYNSSTKVVTSDLTAGGGTGTTNLTETNQTNHPPGFVDPAAGNYHLLPTSALLDIGDPAATAGTDIDGDPRALSKDPQPCVTPTAGTRDIGADEYSCVSPDTTIDLGPTGVTNDTTPTFSFSSTEAGSSFECSLDGAPFASCSSPVTTVSLSDGAHMFGVRAIDFNGNPDPSPASRSFTVSTATTPPPPPTDTTPPETTVSGKPKVKTRKKKARVTWTFGSSEPGLSFACSLDGRPFTPCTSPFTAKLRRGSHTLSVRSADAAGNVDPSPASFTTKVKRKRVRR